MKINVALTDDEAAALVAFVDALDPETAGAIPEVLVRIADAVEGRRLEQ